MDPTSRSEALLAEYRRLVLSELPAGARIFDAHTHLGDDIDGMTGRREELLAIQREHHIDRSFFFCLDEPDRHPAFRAANDRTLAETGDGGELVPFVRLDLNESPLEEAIRCLDLGARGIKLHPRAQAFLPDDPRLEPVFELAVDRRVPILIHGGRGLPPIADDLARLVDKYSPTLIIAHAGIVDLAAFARHFSGRPGVFFDTSVWSPLDLLDLYRQVSPEQVVYASDYPYGRQPNSLFNALRAARMSGLDEAQIRAMLWDNAARISDGFDPLPLSAPRGRDALTHPVTFARIHQYLSMAAAMMWARTPRDTYGVLGLAINACDSSGGNHEGTARIRELLVTTLELWELEAESGEAQGHGPLRAAFRMLHLANTLALTSE